VRFGWCLSNGPEGFDTSEDGYEGESLREDVGRVESRPRESPWG